MGETHPPRINGPKMFGTLLYHNKVIGNGIKTRAKSSYDTCDEAIRAKSQELIWYEL